VKTAFEQGMFAEESIHTYRQTYNIQHTNEHTYNIHTYIHTIRTNHLGQCAVSNQVSVAVEHAEAAVHLACKDIRNRKTHDHIGYKRTCIHAYIQTFIQT
jgi:aspartate ammonia-lyase